MKRITITHEDGTFHQHTLDAKTIEAFTTAIDDMVISLAAPKAPDGWAVRDVVNTMATLENIKTSVNKKIDSAYDVMINDLDVSLESQDVTETTGVDEFNEVVKDAVKWAGFRNVDGVTWEAFYESMAEEWDYSVNDYDGSIYEAFDIELIRLWNQIA